MIRAAKKLDVSDTHVQNVGVSGHQRHPQWLRLGQLQLVLYLVYRPVCKMVLTEFLSGIKFVGP